MQHLNQFLFLHLPVFVGPRLAKGLLADGDQFGARHSAQEILRRWPPVLCDVDVQSAANRLEDRRRRRGCGQLRGQALGDADREQRLLLLRRKLAERIEPLGVLRLIEPGERQLAEERCLLLLEGRNAGVLPREAERAGVRSGVQLQPTLPSALLTELRCAHGKKRRIEGGVKIACQRLPDGI